MTYAGAREVLEHLQALGLRVVPASEATVDTALSTDDVMAMIHLVPAPAGPATPPPAPG